MLNLIPKHTNGYINYEYNIMMFYELLQIKFLLGMARFGYGFDLS